MVSALLGSILSGGGGGGTSPSDLTNNSKITFGNNVFGDGNKTTSSNTDASGSGGLAAVDWNTVLDKLAIIAAVVISGGVLLFGIIAMGRRPKTQTKGGKRA